ncbi:MAG: hypothetical protein PF574_05655 [Candidatus Delongbacteria bacterium]|jgi:hypothetical protein|nr:hypothetical protein [Candidatus Delongbacteria bacterium]
MKLLLDHFEKSKKALESLSELISTAKHPGNLGTAREGLISNFLMKNLPEYISYHSGEIFDSDNRRSGQIDIVLHPITSPKINLLNSINMFPVDTVLAAIEVKSNLTTGKKTGELNNVLSSCTDLKKLCFVNVRNSYAEITDPDRIPFLVFAYKGPTLKTLTKHLKQKGSIIKSPDLIVVLDRGYYLVKKSYKTHLGITVENMYTVVNANKYVLLGLFEYILKLIECWFKNPSETTMPITEYTQKLRKNTFLDLL